MFAKLKNRFNATRFEFTLHVHSLQPWPAGNKAIAIGWQRGKRRKGATNSVFPLPTPEKLGTVVRFNEKFNVSATLYKAAGADKNSQVGPFKKKCLILAILETDGRTHATAALGRVVIDLAEHASIDGQEICTFQVACNKSIHAAVGEPKLTLTLRSRWKKAGADMTEDEVASMSTDTTGSNLTSNLRDFVSRGKPSKSKKESDQDLLGFDGRAAAAGGMDAMETIGEEDGDAHLAGRAEAYREADEAGYDSPRDMRDLDDAEGMWDNADYDVAGTLNLHDDDDYGHAHPVSAVVVPPSPSMPGRAQSSKGGRWRMESMGSGETTGSVRMAPQTPVPVSEKAPDMTMRPRASATKTTQTDTSDFLGIPAPELDDTSALQDELLIAAAVEFGVYNGSRALLPGRAPGRVIHSPARRIARTLVCLGRQDGLPFGHLALRHIEASVVGHRSDVQQLAYWWTNCCHLRGFLQSLNLAMPQDGVDGEVQLHWAPRTFVPKLLAQEKFIFDELVSYMWTHTLVPHVAASRAKAPQNALTGTSFNKRAGHEAALRKWLESFELVNAQLKAVGRYGHVSTLRQQVLLELLKRVDVLLFHYLLTVPAPDGEPLSEPATPVSGRSGPSDGPAPLMDPRHPNMPVLDENMLFFTRGLLTFGAGMNLKMACTRFQQWSFGEGGLREIWAQLPEQGQSLFPYLKGAADLLMMPKDLLLDEGIREDMCANLPFSTVVFIANRFQADDFAHDGIPGDVLAALRSEASGAGVDYNRPPDIEVEAEGTYYSPTDDMVMEKVEVGEEPGLEYDADSEDELDALGALNSDPEVGIQKPLRFKLLHNLWSAGVPRSRRITIHKDAGI
eukprot:jgi/Chrzof1/1570/Cz10g12240.t1